MNQHSCLIVLLVLPPITSWAADTRHTASIPTQAVRPTTTALEQSGAESVITSTPQAQSRFSREAWGMSEVEWTRYLELMRGIRGSVSQANISPLEVLGIHAESDEERRDYARRFAQLMKEDTERVLAFTKAYGDEASKLNGGSSIIDKTLLQLASMKPDALIEPGDRLLLFTRIQPCADCEHYLNAATEAADRGNVQLDLYFHDAADDQAIRDWVNRHALDPERIKAKRITFNHHRGELGQLAGVTATIPKLIRLRGTSAVFLDPNQLNP